MLKIIRVIGSQCLEFAENEEEKCRRNYSISAEREIIKDFNQTPVPEGRLVRYQESSGIRYRTLPARGPWMAMTAVKGHLSLYMVESATKCIARAGRRKTKGAWLRVAALSRFSHAEVRSNIYSDAIARNNAVSDFRQQLKPIQLR